MRKLNAVLSMFLLVLFLLHAILGSLQMLGSDNAVVKSISWITLALAAIHVVIGIKFTVDTVLVSKKTGVSYYKANKLFWARRISGFAIIILLVFHMTAFSYTADGALRLHWFTSLRLATQILLVAAVAVHVITNVKPAMISLGIKSFKKWALDILIILSVLILFMTIAFIIYYLRWNVF